MFAFSKWSFGIFVLYCLLVVHAGIIFSHPVISADKSDNPMTDLDMVDDNANVESAVLNYLFAKEFFNRMRRQVNVRDLQRKRSYWKQCAFNAVSCFG